MIDWLINPDGSPGKSHNIVFGCKGKCPYCYGRAMAKRFKMAEKMVRCEMIYKNRKEWWMHSEWETLIYNFKNFNPTFRPSVLAQKLQKKPTMYFFSMSDPASWKQEWYDKILEKITQYMQHTFVILTKKSEIYLKYNFPHNCWLGVTIENQLQLNELECLFSNYLQLSNQFFISIEPIQGPIKISLFMKRILDWIIVGPETGNRVNRVIAKPAWLENFYDLSVPVFMKKSCQKIVNKKLRQDWPEGYLKEKTNVS